MSDANERDVFYRQDVYPDASGLISWLPATLDAVKDVAIVVVDTNALLVPYATGKASLDEIGKKYRSLVDQNRLVVPGQVVREFASNRSVKLQELHQQLSRKRQLAISRGSYPLLEGLDGYADMIRLEDELDETIRKYKQAVDPVIAQVRRWHWNDPISVLYQSLFNANVVQDPAFDRDDLTQDLAKRVANAIPPGYKDSRKDDGGLGDLIIWRTILEIGKSRRKHLLFVSGDQKPDWWHQSEGSPLYPRFELIDEYRRSSGGQTLHIISFSDFLELAGASPKIVDEVRKEELELQIPVRDVTDEQTSGSRAVEAAATWLRNKYAKLVASRSRFFDYEIAGDDGRQVGVRLKYSNNDPPADWLQRSLDKFSQRLDDVARQNPQVYGLKIIFIAHHARAAASLAKKAQRLRIPRGIQVIVGYTLPGGGFEPVIGLPDSL